MNITRGLFWNRKCFEWCSLNAEMSMVLFREYFPIEPHTKTFNSLTKVKCDVISWLFVPNIHSLYGFCRLFWWITFVYAFFLRSCTICHVFLILAQKHPSSWCSEHHIDCLSVIYRSKKVMYSDMYIGWNELKRDHRKTVTFTLLLSLPVHTKYYAYMNHILWKFGIVSN